MKVKMLKVLANFFVLVRDQLLFNEKLIQLVLNNTFLEMSCVKINFTTLSTTIEDLIEWICLLATLHNRRGKY